MLRYTRNVTSAIFGLAAVVHLASHSLAADAPALFVPSKEAAKTLLVTTGHCESFNLNGTPWLRLIPEAAAPAEVTFNPSAGEWDLSLVAGFRVSLKNPNRSPMTVRLSALNPDAKGLMNSCRNAVELLPGEQRDFFMRLTRRPDDPTYKVFDVFYMYFKGMNVRDNTLDPAHVSKLVLAIDGADIGQGVEVSAIMPSGQGVAAPVPFFPFIDEYGQYAHGDWPGKIYSDSDFADRVTAEEREQAGWPRPKEWDQYGGWAKGPTLKATGFFRVTKYENKWWFVDPDGRLFWSYGPTGVGFGGDTTPVSDRENWFAALPKEGTPLAQFFKDGWGATYRYYQYRWWRGFDIQRANLFRKFGPDYEHEVAAISHERLHSWGFNTMGNWSDSKIYLLHKTPYTVAISYGSALIHFHMPDVYDPGWEPAVRDRMKSELNKTADDPWNLGYFVDNERWFGWRPRGAAIGEETMKNPPERKAKIKFVDLLKDKYKTIDALNAAWETQHASWDALLNFLGAPDMKNPKVLQDCGDFGMMFAERYFTVCRSAVKDVAPNNLYLGSRFFGHTDPELVKMAAKYCDVISYNIYDNPPDSRVNEYAKLDVPIMSTEWGIGSDPMQTPFRDAKLTAPTPAERAATMTKYTEHALRLPNLVGAHFFQYRDQPLSGRADGEATLRGFVNVADTPNFELVQANRRVAYTMYETRANAK